MTGHDKQRLRRYSMRTFLKQDTSAHDATWGCGLVCMIVVTAVIALESLTSSIYIGQKHSKLEDQLQAGRAYIDELLASVQTGDLLENSTAYLSAFQNTDISIVKRVKRESGKRRSKNRRRGRGSRRSRRKNSYSSFHLVIDSEFSHPGNTQMKTGEKAVIAWWKADRTSQNTRQRFATLNNDGTVTIKKAGVYYIYSQVTYFDRTGSWSHRVDVGDRALFKCIASEWGVGVDSSTGKYFNVIHQCITGGATRISKGKKVAIRSMYPNRTIHADTDVTFWGLIKLN